MRDRKVVLIERLRCDDAFPWTGVVPDEQRIGRLIRLPVLVNDELRNFPRLLRPTLETLPV
jgi:hypothetical protein